MSSRLSRPFKSSPFRFVPVLSRYIVEREEPIIRPGNFGLVHPVPVNASRFGPVPVRSGPVNRFRSIDQS